MGSQDGEGGVYQDEDGNLIMYGDQMMEQSPEEDGEHHEMMGESYEMEGSPGEVIRKSFLII